MSATMCYQSFCWMRKYKWRILFIVLFLILLAFPPAVLTRVRVVFADSSYEKTENLKILVSRSDETIPFSGLKTTYARKGESRIWFLDPVYRKGTYIRRLDPIDSEYDEVIQIRSVSVTFSGLGGFTLEGEALAGPFPQTIRWKFWRRERRACPCGLQGRILSFSPRKASAGSMRTRQTGTPARECCCSLRFWQPGICGQPALRKT